MTDIIESAFDKMVEEYRHTLRHFYPSRGGTGFTEANMVHQFVRCLMECIDGSSKSKDAIAWFEFPWESKDQHIDALVHSEKRRTVYYIEAKRMKYKTQWGSIERDIERIDGDKPQRDFVRRCFKERKVETEVLIVLADVWRETAWKKGLPGKWSGSDPLWKDWDSWVRRVKPIWPDGPEVTRLSDSALKNYVLLIGWKALKAGGAKNEGQATSGGPVTAGDEDRGGREADERVRILSGLVLPRADRGIG